VPNLFIFKEVGSGSFMYYYSSFKNLPPVFQLEGRIEAKKEKSEIKVLNSNGAKGPVNRGMDKVNAELDS
jgi:hypothetical protein